MAMKTLHCIFHIFLVCVIITDGFRANTWSNSNGSKQKTIQATRFITIKMHMHHDHSHSHNHNHEHDHQHNHIHLDPGKILQQLKNPRNIIQHPRGRVILIASALLVISSIIRRKVTKLNVIIFGAFTASLSVFDVLKSATKSWISRMKILKDGILKHSTPITTNYFFKNDNLADRVTLLGVAVNIVLSIAKFLGGIAFNSAVLVADAGHSLSDLFSDFITLWAVQIARLPPDQDHPYGHGKFESVGSLFLALTLIATGLSVGVWSYDKMISVLAASSSTSVAAVQKGMATAAVTVATTVAAGHAGHGHGHGHQHGGLFGSAHVHPVQPSWPALGLALVSIISKEWLFRITKRIGETLNSQILIANAWYDISYKFNRARHHRSDSFSSILSLASIAAAIYLPGFLIADSAAGILIAGMISLTGLEVFMESVKQLTDTANDIIVPDVIKVAKAVEGVRGIKNIRARSVGGGNLVDMTVLTDMKLSTSAAHAIAERTRWQVMETIPQVLDVLVRTQASETICPLLSRNQRSTEEIEKEVRDFLLQRFGTQTIQSCKRITIHYVNSTAICIEVLLTLDPRLSIEEAKQTAREIKQCILQQEDIIQAEIQLDLSDDYENAEQILLESMKHVGGDVDQSDS